jgi:hypothetical protein
VFSSGTGEFIVEMVDRDGRYSVAECIADGSQPEIVCAHPDYRLAMRIGGTCRAFVMRWLELGMDRLCVLRGDALWTLNGDISACPSVLHDQ